jgi:hypothetical protein
MRRRFSALVAVLILMVATGCQPDSVGETTTEAVVDASSTTTADTSSTTTVQSTTTTFATFPTEDLPSRFEKGELVAVFGFSIDDRATLRGLPTDSPDAPFSLGSGNFDRQATDLVASGIAKNWEGGPTWEHLGFGEPDEYGNLQYSGFIEPFHVGFLGATETVTDEVVDMTNERVDDLGMEVAEYFADNDGLEAVPITQREYGGRELTFDLIGGIDEATAGWRIHVVMEEDGDLFRVVQVERTLFCWFAVDESGACLSNPRS